MIIVSIVSAHPGVPAERVKT